MLKRKNGNANPIELELNSKMPLAKLSLLSASMSIPPNTGSTQGIQSKPKTIPTKKEPNLVTGLFLR